MQTIELLLYSTSHCHLCEQADALLTLAAKERCIHWDIIEITDDDALLNLYELKIPVLKRLDNHKELCWPFTFEDITRLIYEPK